MTVRVYQRKQGTKNNWLSRFLKRYRVKHEYLKLEDLGSCANSLMRDGSAAAVEVNGRIFVNPNEDALRKLLLVG